MPRKAVLEQAEMVRLMTERLVDRVSSREEKRLPPTALRRTIDGFPFVGTNGMTQEICGENLKRMIVQLRLELTTLYRML